MKVFFCSLVKFKKVDLFASRIYSSVQMHKLACSINDRSYNHNFYHLRINLSVRHTPAQTLITRRFPFQLRVVGPASDELICQVCRVIAYERNKFCTNRTASRLIFFFIVIIIFFFVTFIVIYYVVTYVVLCTLLIYSVILHLPFFFPLHLSHICLSFSVYNFLAAVPIYMSLKTLPS